MIFPTNRFPSTPEEFSNAKCLCSSWVASAVVGSAAIGGAVKAYSASAAAGAQGAAASTASQQQIAGALEGWKQIQSYYGLAQDQLQPYQQLGKTGINAITPQLPDLTKTITSSDAQKNLASPLPVSQQQLDLRDPLQVSQQQQDLAGPLGISQEQMDLRNPIQLTQQQLEQIPGYQFELQQGLKAVQNSAAARGLGTSGAAQKGAATFATGLASEKALAFGAQEMQNRQDAFNRYAATYGQAAAEREAAAGRFGQIFAQQAGERQAATGREAAIFGQQASERQASTGREQQLFQNQVTGTGTAFDRLMALINPGANAASVGSQEATITGKAVNDTFGNLGKNVSSNTIGAGNATAAATNAIGGAVSDAANNIGGYAAYKGIGGYGTGGPGQNPPPAFNPAVSGANNVFG